MPSPPDIFSASPRIFRCAADPNLPTAAVGFLGIDDGRASNPKFMRPTTTVMGKEGKMLKNAGLPFGVVLSPLHGPLEHNQNVGSEYVPVIYDRPPVRCHRCRGYIHSGVRFSEMGRRWTCTLCLAANTVTDDYFCNLTLDGTREDAHLKPELSRATVEWDVENVEDYALRSATTKANTTTTSNNSTATATAATTTNSATTRPSRPFPHLFVLDVSGHAARTFLPDYLVAVREGLTALRSSSPNSPVSFLLYAQQLHYCDFRHPRMPLYSVPDVGAPFVPLPFENLCWLHLEQDWNVIEQFLDTVPTISSDLNEDGCAVGAAVEAAIQIFGSQPGGRVFLSAHLFPRTGKGSEPPPRDYRKLYESEKVKDLLRPMSASPQWSQWATAAATAQISFDLHFFPNAEYSELVTLSQLSHLTGGEVAWFPHYAPGPYGQAQLIGAVRGRCEEEVGYAGILRVRCSPGLRVQKYHGHFISQNPLDMDLATVTARSNYFVEITHEAKLNEAECPTAHLQMALLFTTRDGRRRVRVCNFPLPIVSDYAMLFQYADLEATFFGVVAAAVSEALNRGIPDARHLISNAPLKACIGYEKFALSTGKIARGSGAGMGSATLRLPSALKMLPMYCLALLKTEAFCVGNKVPMDVRIAQFHTLLSIPLPELLTFVYPDVFPLHTLASNAEFGRPVVSAVTSTAAGVAVHLPPRRIADYTSIAKTGVYLLCDEPAGMVYLWIGSMVPEEVSLALFGVPEASSVCRQVAPGAAAAPGGGAAAYTASMRPTEITPEWMDRFSDRLRHILDATLSRYGKTRRLMVMHEGDLAEEIFFRQLKGEKSDSGPSYSQGLQKLQTDIRMGVLS